MIRLICFDMDDTLFDFHKGERIALMEAMAEIGELCSEADYHLYEEINDRLWKSLEKGEVTKEALKILRFQEFFDATNRHADAVLMSKRYPQYLSEQCFLLPEAENVIRKCHESYRLAVATNGIASVQRHRLAKSGLSDLFSYLFISEEIGAVKPQREFFEEIARISGIGFHEMVMIGDSLSADISGALNCGIKSIWYNFKHMKNESLCKPDYEITDLNEIFDILEVL